MGRLDGGNVRVSRGAAGGEVVAGSSRKDSGVGDGDEVDGGVVWGVEVEARERVRGVVASSERSWAGSWVAPAVGGTGKGVGCVLRQIGDGAGITGYPSLVASVYWRGRCVPEKKSDFLAMLPHPPHYSFRLHLRCYSVIFLQGYF